MRGVCGSGFSTSSFADLDYGTTLDGAGAFIAICINAPQEILLLTSALFREVGTGWSTFEAHSLD
jgi:hypothetical protein